ncbi:Calfacilitin isoform X1 [Aix galericulata]|nr:Calfacilitin isoform X1 [Aix galericulata]
MHTPTRVQTSSHTHTPSPPPTLSLPPAQPHFPPRAGAGGTGRRGGGVAVRELKTPSPAPGHAPPRPAARASARPGARERSAMGPGWRAPSVALVGGSVALFGGLRRAALALPRPAAVRSRPGRVWRWGNLLVSFAHSVLAGLWALLRVPLRGRTPPRAREAPVCPGTRVGLGSRGCTRCAHPIFPLFLLPPPSLWQSPELLSDIQDGYSVSGHLLVCFSSAQGPHTSRFASSKPPAWRQRPRARLHHGAPYAEHGLAALLGAPQAPPAPRYFIHDSLDIIFNHQSRSSWEYLVHHAMVVHPGGQGARRGRTAARGGSWRREPDRLLLPGTGARLGAGDAGIRDWDTGIRPRIGCPRGPRVSRRGSGRSHHGYAQSAISAFISLIVTGRFLVAAMLLLLVEVSNIFLTARMLLKMSNVPSPALYRANKYVNLVMYFAFRLAPQAYLTWYFLRHVEVQGQGAFLMANLLLLDAMILMYFSRLLRSDFCPSLRKGRDVDGEKFLID